MIEILFRECMKTVTNMYPIRTFYPNRSIRDLVAMLLCSYSTTFLHASVDAHSGALQFQHQCHSLAFPLEYQGAVRQTTGECWVAEGRFFGSLGRLIGESDRTLVAVLDWVDTIFPKRVSVSIAFNQCCPS